MVTGANGMLGKHVQEVIKESTDQNKWIFLTRADGDLRDLSVVENLFKQHRPTHVLHLAASLASNKEMTLKPVKFWLDNVTINNNVLKTAHDMQAVKVVSILSTIMIPSDAPLPAGSSDDILYGGRLHAAGEAYGMAKRALAKLTYWYRVEYGDEFSCVLAGNFFGKHGDFCPQTAPLLNALISKAERAKVIKEQLQVVGTGAPLRQIMSASDFARACVWAMFNFNEPEPLIIAGEELSIKSMVELVCECSGYQGEVKFSGIKSDDGPFRRTVDVSRFSQLCPDFKWTPLRDSICQTIEWFKTANKVYSV